MVKLLPLLLAWVLFFYILYKVYTFILQLQGKENKKTELENNKKNEKRHKRVLWLKERNKKLSLLVDETRSRIKSFDKNNDGEVDLINAIDGLRELMQNNSELLNERSKEYSQNFIQQLVRLSNYIEDKKRNIQKLYLLVNEMLDVERLNYDIEIVDGVEHKFLSGFFTINHKYYGIISEESCEELVNSINDEIHSYNLLSINSLNFISSLIDDDQVTFYNIYEKFDKLNIFNTNWENEVTENLSSINDNLKEFIVEMRYHNTRLIESIKGLTSIAINNQNMLEQKLKTISSYLDMNNLLTMINSYQSYQINKNTKSRLK